MGPKFDPRNGRKYLGASPSKKSVQRVKDKIGDLLASGNKAPWPQVRNRLNRLQAGWSAYFSYGTRTSAYQAVDHHVEERVRRFLAKRHKKPGRGTRRFSWSNIREEFGVASLVLSKQRAPVVGLP